MGGTSLVHPLALVPFFPPPLLVGSPELLQLPVALYDMPQLDLAALGRPLDGKRRVQVG